MSPEIDQTPVVIFVDEPAEAIGAAVEDAETTGGLEASSAIMSRRALKGSSFATRPSMVKSIGISDFAS